jgi:hypothetical protein
VDNAILEYETPLTDNAYPNITFTFVYGSYCGELETLPIVASVTEGTVTDTEASVTVTATQGTYALATVNFTEDDAKIPAQSFPVNEDNIYTITELTADTDYSFTITVTDADGNKSEPFATKWTFTTTGDDDVSIDKVNADNFSVYPVPAQDILHVSGLDAAKEVRVIDVTGHALSIRKVDRDAIDVSGLAKGIYILSIDGKAVKFTKN